MLREYPAHKEHIMVIKKSLYQISQQTGIPRGTLYYRADKLFGRHEGEFTKEEEEKLVDFVEDPKEPYKCMSGETIQENGSGFQPDIQNNGKDEATLTLDTLSLPSLSYSPFQKNSCYNLI